MSIFAAASLLRINNWPFETESFYDFFRGNKTFILVFIKMQTRGTVKIDFNHSTSLYVRYKATTDLYESVYELVSSRQCSRLVARC